MKKSSAGKKVALATKIVCASIGVLPASLLVLAQIDICTTMSPKCLDHSRFFRDIVATNANFGETPISNIGMLGSHDCMADGIGMFTGISPHQMEDETLYKWANFLGRGAMVRLSRAQDVNIYDQLNAGVRYIDARITKIDGVYYNSHTLLADKFENNLKLILKWLDENPGEFIVIYIYGFYYDKSETKADAWNGLRDFIKSVTYNGHNLFDYDYYQKTKIEQLTYNNVTNSGAKAGAIMFYCGDGEVSLEDQKLWCFDHVNFNGTTMLRVNGSAGTMQSGKFKDHINTRVNDVKKIIGEGGDISKYVKYLQIQTRPNENDIMETATSWSLIEKARYHNRYVLDLFTQDQWVNDILPYMPVILCDNVTCNVNGFNTDVMNILTKYNLSL